jgi:hypothetical protein
MRILDWILAILIGAFGVVHCAVTPLIYHTFSQGSLWFFGTGLALIFASMLNILRLKGPASPLLRTFCIAANASVLLVAVLFVLRAHLGRNLAHNPQGIVLLGALGGELLFSLSTRH